MLLTDMINCRDAIASKNDRVDSKIEDMGYSYMFKEKFINQP